MKLIRKIALLAMIASISACATIFDGSTDIVTFNSTPSGANIYLDGEFRGQTPLVLNLKRRSYSIEARKEGYITAHANSSTSINPWIFGNIITGGVVGTTTDVVSTAAFEFDQNQWIFMLQPNNTAAQLSYNQAK